MLGDSVAYYGDSSEDTFVGKLEAKLNEDSGLAPSEVINAGVRGYTNYQELLFLKKYGPEFEPDLVGVAFVLNDLHPFLHEFRMENGEVVGEYVFVDEAVQSVDNPVYRLVRKSHFLVWLRRKLDVFESLIESYSQDDFAFKYRPDFNTAWDEEPWTAIEEQLSEMVQMGEIYGFRIFLVSFPFGEQYRDDYLAKDYAYVTMPQRRLMDICEALDIPFLDLYPVLDRDIHLDADDIHLTKPGRAMVAEEIAEFLADENLIPTPSVSSK
jgi:lysophospholipase L1-like esterase